MILHAKAVYLQFDNQDFNIFKTSWTWSEQNFARWCLVPITVRLLEGHPWCDGWPLHVFQKLANGYQKKMPEKYHPISSSIIQHHPASSNISTNSSSFLHQRLFVAQWLLLHCFVLNEFTCVQVDRHHLARPQPPFGFEHVLRIRRTSRRFCGSERDGFLAGSDANVRLWGNGS